MPHPGPLGLRGTFLVSGSAEAIAPTAVTVGTSVLPLGRSRRTSSCQSVRVTPVRVARVSV